MTLRDQILANVPASVPRLAHVTGTPILQVEGAVAALVREGVLYRLGGMFHRYVEQVEPEPVKYLPKVPRRKPDAPWCCATCGEKNVEKRSPNHKSYCRMCRNAMMRAGQKKWRMRRAHQTRVLKDQVALLEARVRELEASHAPG